MRTHTGTGGSAPGSTVREEALVARLTALAPSLDGEPDPEWQARTRARLVAMAAVRTPEPAPAPPLRRFLARAEGTRSAWRSRLTAGLAGAAAAVTGLAAVVALSADARPGDALYGVKRGTEQTQLALAGDARGRTLLAFASTRLEELAAAVGGRAPAGLVEETLATMDAQTVDGAAWLTQRAVETGSSAPLDDLSGWSASQSAGLGELLADVPEGARGEAEASAVLLDDIAERVADLRVALACAEGPATAGTDELGPVPARCAAPAGPPADGGTTGPQAPQAPATGAPSSPVDGSPGPGTAPSDPGTRPDGGPGTAPGTDGVPVPTTPRGPGTPGLPTPELPTLLPGPDGTVLPSLPTTPLGGSAAPSSGVVPEVIDDLTCTVRLLDDC